MICREWVVREVWKGEIVRKKKKKLAPTFFVFFSSSLSLFLACFQSLSPVSRSRNCLDPSLRWRWRGGAARASREASREAFCLKKQNVGSESFFFSLSLLLQPSEAPFFFQSELRSACSSAPLRSGSHSSPPLLVTTRRGDGRPLVAGEEESS